MRAWENKQQGAQAPDKRNSTSGAYPGRQNKSRSTPFVDTFRAERKTNTKVQVPRGMFK